MVVNHYLTLYLTAPTATVIEAVQGDGVRVIAAQLMEGAEPWPVPEGVTAGIGYALPDKTGGYYDQLRGGTPACMIAGNLVTAAIDGSLTAIPGNVKLAIVLRDGSGGQVATFPITMRVAKRPGRIGAEEMAPVSAFDGKLIMGGTGGETIPVEVGSGLNLQRDGNKAVLTAPGGGGGGNAPGVAPTIQVEQTEDGATITATDSNGTTTATIRNGKDGADGKDGKDGKDAVLPADLFGGYDRFYRSIARGRVNPEEPLDVATYDGSGQLTHPCVRHFPEGVAGHSWWMTASPYPNSALELENPCVWYSDDGIHWSADGIPNPLDLPLTVNGAQASMNSDPHLLVRPDGVMEVWWRTNYWENSGEGLYTVVYRRTSTDGVNWTAKEELHRMLTNSADGIVCPVALYEDGVYKIWAVSDQECLRYYESATGAAWRHIRDIDVSNPDYPEYKVWHFDVNHTAKGYEFVGCYNIPGDYTSHKYLYYAVSQDNITYSKRVMILTRGETGRFDERLVYRPTIVRMADRVRIYYGANNADNVWSIGLMEAPSAYLFNAVLISGARVGAIESGQEWLDGRVTALEAGGGGDDRPADEGVTVVRSFDESPWLPGYWDPSNDGALTLYSNMHRTQLVELASLTVDGELPEITAKSSMAAWALVRFNYFDGNLRWIGADMGAFIDPGAGTQEPTRLRWPAGAVYVAISANTADKGAVTVSGVPEGGDCEISQEQIQKIAGIAAGMVEVPGGGDNWEFIGEFNVGGSDVEEWIVSEDAGGNPIQLRRMYFEATFEAATGAIENTYLDISNPAYPAPWGANQIYCRIPAGLRASRNKNNVWADYIPAGSGYEIVAHFSPSAHNLSWGQGNAPVNAHGKYIGGVAFKAGDATKAKIGAGSIVKIWGVRM